MAQPGRAQRSGRWGRWFKSSRPDHFASKLYLKFKPVLFKKLQTCIYHLNIIMISSRSCSLTFESCAALSLTQTSNSSCVGLLVIRKPYDSLLPKRIMAILCRSSHKGFLNSSDIFGHSQSLFSGLSQPDHSLIFQ